MEESLDPDRVREELRALEPIFHRSPPDSGRAVFERMTSPDFFEVGASGRVYARDFVLDIVAQRYRAGNVETDLKVRSFEVHRLSRESWIATYELDQGGRLSRRATVWSRIGLVWRAHYHQGTLI